MEITLLRPVGSYKAGKTVNVDARLAKVLISAGKATDATPPPEPARPRRMVTAPQEPARVASVPPTPTPPVSELNALLKSQLVETANGLGITLDGSETKADLITLIERARRRTYARRDMQAEK